LQATQTFFRGGDVARIAEPYLHKGGITPAQEKILREELGVLGELPWMRDKAAALIRRLRQERALIEAQGIVTPWEKGEVCLRQGYTVEPVEGEGLEFCYRVIRPSERVASNPDGRTVAYWVNLRPTGSEMGCDCPDYANNGDLRPCKHILTAMVALWQWAQESGEPTQYDSYLTDAGVMSLRAAYMAAKNTRSKK
jgi:hypothetical protein